MKPGFRVLLETGFHMLGAPYFKGFHGLLEVHAFLTQSYRGRRAFRSHRLDRGFKYKTKRITSGFWDWFTHDNIVAQNKNSRNVWWS